MKSLVIKLSVIYGLVLTTSCQFSKTKTETTNFEHHQDSIHNLLQKFNNFFTEIPSTEAIHYKDTIIDVMLVERNVRWNRSARGTGTYSFDKQLGMVIVNVSPINKGRQTHSFNITEVLPADFTFFIDREISDVETNLANISSKLKSNFSWKGKEYFDSMAKFDYNNRLFSDYHSKFKEKIKTSNATIKFAWHVSGDNNPLRRYPGRVEGGLRVTLRKYFKPR